MAVSNVELSRIFKELNFDLEKTQSLILSTNDELISFSAPNHVYKIRSSWDDLSRPVTVTCTGFIGKLVDDKFDPKSIIIKKLNKTNWQYKIIQVIDELCRWEFAGPFGSLVHLCLEIFFQHFISCDHPECLNQYYHKKKYDDLMMELTNSRNLSMGILSQSLSYSETLKPRLVCQYVHQNFCDYLNLLTSKNHIADSLKNHRFSPINVYNKQQKMIAIMDSVFAELNIKDTEGRQLYVSRIEDMINQYEGDSVKRFIKLKPHLILLMKNLALNRYMNIYSEYMVFHDQKDLAGCVDLLLLDRFDPSKVVIYDWKTSLNMFKEYFSKESSYTQKYSCQLHTYANLIADSNHLITQVDALIVQVNENNALCATVSDHKLCQKCTPHYNALNKRKFETHEECPIEAKRCKLTNKLNKIKLEVKEECPT